MTSSSNNPSGIDPMSDFDIDLSEEDLVWNEVRAEETDDLIPEPERQSPNGEPEDGDIGWDAPEEPVIGDFFEFDLVGEDRVDRSGLNALINSAIVAQRRMPMLDVVLDRAARRMTRSFRQLTDENLEVSLEDVATKRFGDFLHSHDRASVIGVMHSKNLDAYALIVSDAALMLAVLDLLLGGRRGDLGFFDDFRALTQIELGLAERVIKSMIDDFNASLKAVFDADFTLDRIETIPRFAAIAQEPSVCAVGKYKVRMGERNAAAMIVLPHTAIEPLGETLQRDFIGEHGSDDHLWRRRIDEEVRAARVDINAVLAEKNVALKELNDLSVGDLLVFPASPKSVVTLTAGGRAIVQGRLGRAGERIAVCLQRAVPQTGLLSDRAPDHDQSFEPAAAFHRSHATAIVNNADPEEEAGNNETSLPNQKGAA